MLSHQPPEPGPSNKPREFRADRGPEDRCAFAADLHGGGGGYLYWKKARSPEKFMPQEKRSPEHG